MIMTYKLVFLLLCITLPAQQVYAHAARVIFTHGTVIIKTSKGKTIQAKRGSKVRRGDIIITKKDSRTQIRAGDGSFISLQPKSKLRITAHKHTGSVEEQHSMIELIKGGMRTVTGLIGKNKPDNFRIKVRQSSIGIRGTEFVVQICDNDCNQTTKNKGKAPIDNGIYVGLISGAITVENNKKIVILDAGLNVLLGVSMGVSKEKFQYVYIENDDAAPETLAETPKVLVLAMAAPPPVPLSKREATTQKPKHQLAPYEGIDIKHLQAHLASTAPVEKARSAFEAFEQVAYPGVPDVLAGLREIRLPYAGRNINDGQIYDLTSGQANYYSP